MHTAENRAEAYVAMRQRAQEASSFTQYQQWLDAAEELAFRAERQYGPDFWTAVDDINKEN